MEIDVAVATYQLAGIKTLGYSYVSVRVCHNISIESLSPTRTIPVFSHILKLDTPQGNLSKSISIKSICIRNTRTNS